MSCDPALLDALVAGELAGDDLCQIQDHVAACADCAAEVVLLEAELRLFRERQVAPASHLWSGVERKISRRWSWMPLWSTVPALAVLLLVMRTAPSLFSKPPLVEQKRPPAARVLDAAEREYAAAVATLETRYRSKRQELPAAVAKRVDAELLRGQSALAEARLEAGRDDDARWMVLDRYADYLHSLHSLLLDLEVD